MDHPKITYWVSDEGSKPIADLTREELLSAVAYLASENESLRRSLTKAQVGRFDGFRFAPINADLRPGAVTPF